MKKLSKSAICVVLAVIFYFAATEFMLELLALGWHARHGMTAKLRGAGGKTYSVPVPMFWLASVDDGGWVVSLSRKPQRIRALLHDREWALMSFSVAPTSTASEIRQTAPALNSKLGLALNEVAAISVAGQDLHCFEQKFEKGKAAELSRIYGAVDLRCVPESDKRGFSATYIGSSGLVPEFYRVLRGVTLGQTAEQH